MSIQVKHTRDEIGPDLRRKLAKVKDLRPFLRAAGTQLVSISKRAFS